MFTKKQIVLSTLLCLLPIVPGLLLYSRMPESVPVHFDFNGTPNGYASRAIAVFALPVIMAVLNVFALLMVSADPKRANIGKGMRLVFLWMIPAVSLLCAAQILPSAIGQQLNLVRFIFIFVGLLFLIIGNYLPKTKQNYTAGLRLPWTLNSEENWNRTHRLAGRLYMLCGIAFIIMGLLGVMNYIVFFGVIIAASVVPGIYSYLLYKKGI